MTQTGQILKRMVIVLFHKQLQCPTGSFNINKAPAKDSIWKCCLLKKKVSEYDLEISQSYTADNQQHCEDKPQNIYSNKHL